MDQTEKLLVAFNSLSDAGQIEVLDFVEFLHQKEQKELEQLINKTITENLEAFKELAK